jgi:hypothetical protein
MADFYGHAGEVRAFLAHTRILDGCIWRPDIEERLTQGRTLIEAFASALPEEGFELPTGAGPELWDSAQCAAVLELLSCLDANYCHCKCGEATCGYDDLLDHLRDSMLAVGGALNGPPALSRPRLVVDNTRESRP